MNTRLQKITHFLQRSKQRSIQVIQDIKRNQSNREILQLPWYLVIGDNQSGVSSLIAASKINIIPHTKLSSNATQYVHHFPEFTWWFSNDAVFIEVQNFSSPEILNTQSRLCKLLRKTKRKKPLAGIILTIPIRRLQAFNIKNIQPLSQLQQKLNAKIPFYFVLTKCDQLAGFSEFFNDLSQEELTQVWGVTLPLAYSRDTETALAFLNHALDQLIDNLQRRIIEALNAEKNQSARDRIYAFPQQIELLRPTVLTIVHAFLKPVPGNLSFVFRGIYFTSAKQAGETEDLLAKAIGLPSTTEILNPKQQEPFFIESLFHAVILPESKFLGYSESTLKFKSLKFKFQAILIPSLTIILAYCLIQSYIENKLLLQYTQHDLYVYQQLENNITATDSDISHTLPMLNTLYQLNQRYEKNSLLSPILFSYHNLRYHAEQSLKRSLHSLFLPRIANYLEQELKQPHLQDNDSLYAILKGYLAFSPSAYTEASAIIAPLEYRWAEQYHHQPKIQHQLRYYINLAAQDSMDQLPLNRPLINKIRLQLQEINPAQRAFGLLNFKASTQDLPNINFENAIGHNFYSVFNANGVNHEIPALYTTAGYQQIYRKEANNIAKQVENDNREIGIKANNNPAENSKQIESELKKLYIKRYQDMWNQQIDQLSIKPFHYYTEAIDILTLLSSEESPINKLLQIILDNENHINPKNFKQYIAIIPALKNMAQLLAEIKQSPTPDKTAFDITKMYIQTGNVSPLRQLTNTLDNMPEPVKRWLTTLINNSWQLITNAAEHYLNDVWSNEILPSYQDNIANHYPIDPQSTNPMTLDKFRDFFAAGGIVGKFSSQYLMPFIDCHTPEWKVYNRNQLYFPVSNNLIQLLQQLHTIQQRYFNHEQQPSITFTLQPLTLSAISAGTDIVFGENHLSYHHGPRMTKTIEWPLPLNNNESKFVFNEFPAGDLSTSFSGPWSLFQLLQHGTLHFGQTSNALELSFTSGPHHQSYSLYSENSLSTLLLQPLSGFALPNLLFPSLNQGDLYGQHP